MSPSASQNGVLGAQGRSLDKERGLKWVGIGLEHPKIAKKNNAKNFESRDAGEVFRVGGRRARARFASRGSSASNWGNLRSKKRQNYSNVVLRPGEVGGRGRGSGIVDEGERQVSGEEGEGRGRGLGS